MTQRRVKRIVIVDEDAVQMAPFEIELNLRGFEVTTYKTAEDCLDSLSARLRIDLFVIDIMLACRLESPAYTRAQTNDYLLTGLVLARDIRRRRKKTPILLFSNTSNAELLKIIRSWQERIQDTHFLPKYFVNSPMEFGEIVTRILDEGIPKAGKKGKSPVSKKL